MTDKPKIWLTYAWVDNDEGDFDFLVQELDAIGVQAVYDKVALVPGFRLWQQIGELIHTGDIAGWAYLLTPASLASEKCKEELYLALGRALDEGGESFPLIGLMHGVEIADVPASLRIRLCISLKHPDWPEEVRASLLRQPPERAIAERQSEFVGTRRPALQDGLFLVEIRPRFGEITNWVMGIPIEHDIVRWGFGPAGASGMLNPSRFDVVTGMRADIDDIRCNCLGAGERLSPAVSAYALVRGAPNEVFFTKGTYWQPAQWTKISFRPSP